MSRKKKISGEQALEEAFAAIDTAPLLASLDVELDESFLRLALTHRSFANEHGHLPNNERLEFLGDAVLGLSIAARLYEKYPTRPESDISKMRASIVSRFGLADIAREMGLGAFILLGKGEANSNGRDKDSILADTTEALSVPFICSMVSRLHAELSWRYLRKRSTQPYRPATTWTGRPACRSCARNGNCPRQSIPQPRLVQNTTRSLLPKFMLMGNCWVKALVLIKSRPNNRLLKRPLLLSA